MADLSRVRFRVLGPVELLRDSMAAPLEGSRQRALLAALLIEANHAIAADRLVELIWGESPPRTAPNALQVYVFKLRRALSGGGTNPAPEVLSSRFGGYVLRVEPGELDADLFVELKEQAQTAASEGNLSLAAEMLGSALSMWRGPAYADLYEPFALRERARLESLRLDAQEKRFDIMLALGRQEEVFDELATMAAENPIRERLQGQLMLALYRVGRQAEASEVYQRTRQYLRDELGMEPGPGLQKVLRDILQHQPSAENESSPTIGNLPPAASTFVGRQEQIEELEKLLEGTRALTLIGPGGIGKTSLARELAEAVGDRHADGVWWVDLGPVTDPDLVPEAVASALGLPIQPEIPPSELLERRLHEEERLIVLDTCEHVVDSCARLAASLLARCRSLTLLMTSRERIGVLGEVLWQVPPLQTPDPDQIAADASTLAQFEGVRLFLDRSQETRAEGALADDDLRAIAQICMRLDGIPLAVELAAAQMGVMSAADMLLRLGSGLDLLVGRSRVGEARHRTMRRTIEWSYGLLEAQERILFARLAVFAASFDLNALEAICGFEPISPRESVATLIRLVERSMVIPVLGSGRQARYRLLDTLRQFAESQLSPDEMTRVRALHAAHFSGRAAGAEASVYGPDASAYLDLLDPDQDNAGSASDWAATNDGDLCLEIAANWWPYWWARGLYSEGRSRLERALAVSGPEHPRRLAGLVGLGRLLVIQGDFGSARTMFRQAMALVHHGGVEKARLLNSLGAVATRQGRSWRARVYYLSALSEIPPGQVWARASALNNLATAETELGEIESASRHEAEALTLIRDAGLLDSGGQFLVSMGHLHRVAGNLRAAGERLAEAAAVGLRIDDRLLLANVVEAGAFLAAAMGRPAEALHLIAQAEHRYEALGVTPGWVAMRDQADRSVSHMHAVAGEETARRLRAVGAAMTIEDALAEVTRLAKAAARAEDGQSLRLVPG